MQLDIDRDSDEPGVCLPFIVATIDLSMVVVQWCGHCFVSHAVEELSVCEPIRKKPRLDIDSDSAIGVSVFTDGKSTTMSLSEVSHS